LGISKFGSSNFGISNGVGAALDLDLLSIASVMEWSFGAMVGIAQICAHSRSVLDDKEPVAVILTGSATAVSMRNVYKVALGATQ
jgi:hypothetical protein